MLRLGELSPDELRARLAAGMSLAVGPFRFRVTSREASVAQAMATLYADFDIRDGGFHDFHVRVGRVPGPRRWYRPQVNFWLDGSSPFKPLPFGHAFALLEWGMNWCIAGRAHHYLLLHAAVLERNGCCIVMPGDPGAGKSTLTAALMLSGWRLLSDELAVIDRDDGLLAPLARPINLKNRSIELIRSFEPQAIMGQVAHDTHKGTVAHLRPSPQSTARMHVKARATHVVFPRWQEGTAASLRPRRRADTFLHVANHAFNYSLLGRDGFDLCATLVDGCECWDFGYERFDDALPALAALAA